MVRLEPVEGNTLQIQNTISQIQDLDYTKYNKITKYPFRPPKLTPSASNVFQFAFLPSYSDHFNELHPSLLPATVYLSKIEVEFTESQERAHWDTGDNYRALSHRAVWSNLIK